MEEHIVFRKVSQLECWLSKNSDNPRYDKLYHEFMLAMGFKNNLHKHPATEYLGEFYDESDPLMKILMIHRMLQAKGDKYRNQFSNNRDAWIAYAEPKYLQMKLVDEFGYFKCSHNNGVWENIDNLLYTATIILNDGQGF